MQKVLLMKVFKFGGASISSYDRIVKLPTILRMDKEEKILIVVSAIGKMTNALEKVTDAFYEGRSEDALKLFEKIKVYHLNELKYLITLQWEAATSQLNDVFTEVEWLLHDKPVKDYNYYYDQIVCCGELLSSTLISFFLNEKKIANRWVDVRDFLRTDNTFREAKVDWEYSRKKVKEALLPLFGDNHILITQGFIASTADNESTTLGREGSDYSAAIFAELTGAESVTIWKDVNGVMNADPKEYKNAQTIEELSYKEVIEMAYYGAKVIHPKTIKPLQNHQIPLQVKSFLDLQLRGTRITGKPAHHLPPIIVIKNHQVLFTFQTLNFAFIEGKPFHFIQDLLDQLRIKQNITQTAAISLMIAVDDIPEKTQQIALLASPDFEVQLQKELTLVTIRHYTPEYLENFVKDKEIVLQQRTPETIQLLIKGNQDQIKA